MNRCSHCSAPAVSTQVFCTQCGGALVRAPSSTRLQDAFPDLDMRGEFSLEVVRSAGSEAGHSLSLQQGAQTIGTDGAVCLTADPHASAHHARVTLENGSLRLSDTGSVNGTWLRLRSVEFPLADGEVFRLGEQFLRFDLHLVQDAPSDGEETSGTPLRPWRIKVTQLLEGGGEGLVYSTRRDRMILGREGCDVNFVGDAFVSSTHCELRCRPGAVSLRDLGSLNGTFISVPPGVEVPLQGGDEIAMGRHLLRVVAGS